MVLDKRNPSTCWDLQLQTQIPFRFRTNNTQTPNYQLHPGSNFILYPRSCWDASRADSSAAGFDMVNQLIGQLAMVPAHTTSQESCQLQFGSRSSSYPGKPVQHPLGTWQRQIFLCTTQLWNTGTILKHNNKVTCNRFNQSCVFSCYGNQSQES